MIIKNNHVVMTNQMALLCELARLDNCKIELIKEFIAIDNLPDEERQKIYDAKEDYFRNKPVKNYNKAITNYTLFDLYNEYWVYEKEPNAKTPKFGDQFKN